jgi:ribonuclease R
VAKSSKKRPGSSRNRAARKAAQVQRSKSQDPPQKPVNPSRGAALRTRFGRPHGASKKGALEGGLRRIVGSFQKNRKGFGFIILDDKEAEDLFVPEHQARELFHGDRIEVFVFRSGEIARLRVLEHRYREALLKIQELSHPGAWAVLNAKNAEETVRIPDLSAPGGKSAEVGDYVRVTLQYETKKGQSSVTGKILENYGKVVPARADLTILSGEFGLQAEHSREAIAEAERFRLEVPGKDLEGRRDLREIPFITIDGETARDFDDAVFVERHPKGFVLWVAIADVSHYVKEGTQLDREAFQRATSVYFPERAFHMLPRALSENLCSLRPQEPRLAMTARMIFDRSGKKIETEVLNSVILSKRRATYTEIEREKNDFPAHFELYEILRRYRSQRGSIDFDFPEAKVLVDEQGEPTEIKIEERKDSHRLIEEFMIAANEAVTEWMLERDWPFIFRIHEQPSAFSLQKFRRIAELSGVKFKTRGDSPAPKELAQFLLSVANHPSKSLLNTALLRSLKQAIYSARHDIHYGLASQGYTHFTSPIRRYPDLIVHRLLKLAIRAGGKKSALSIQERGQSQKTLEAQAEHCSYRERLASEAERESIKIKQTRLMMKHLGEEFEGSITGFNPKGMYVRLDQPFLEGFVSIESLGDDEYMYQEDRMMLIGRRKRRAFRMGQRVKVRADRADLERRQIDFTLLSAEDLSHTAS